MVIILKLLIIIILKIIIFFKKILSVNKKINDINTNNFLKLHHNYKNFFSKHLKQIILIRLVLS